MMTSRSSEYVGLGTILFASPGVSLVLASSVEAEKMPSEVFRDDRDISRAVFAEEEIG